MLTVWRFGLGRVATLTADNGLTWGMNLMEADSGRVVSATTNWAIGDLERSSKVRISSEDTSLGGRAHFSVSSPSLPSVSIKNVKTLEQPQQALTRSTINTYSGSFTPVSGGFYGLSAKSQAGSDIDLLAVNYPIEYATLGVDQDTLRRISAASGSRLYSTQEIDALISDIYEKAKKSSTKQVLKETEVWQYLAAAALALYFIDAIIRRLHALFKKT